MFSCSTDNIIIKINSEQLVKYIYYYLLININILQKGFIGVGLQHISKDYLCNIKIKIPSIEQQYKIIKYCESNNTFIKQLEDNIIQNKKKAQLFISSIIKSHNIFFGIIPNSRLTTKTNCYFTSFHNPIPI